MTPLPQIALDRIRHHESSQQRAWEELAYILIPDIESLPAETVLERRAAPDGGVEFSCPSPTGKGRWAWQAKFLFRLTASAFNQMTRSLTDALDSTTDVSRYTFVLPMDRTKSELDRWAKKVADWSKIAMAKNMTVDFAFVGESQTLAALTMDKNAGSVRYFFDETLLTDDFFRRQVDQEVRNLGARYDPLVNVEIEFADVLGALCRTPSFVARVLGAFDEIEKQDRKLAEPPAVLGDTTAVGATRRALGALSSLMRSHQHRVGLPDASVLNELEASLRECSATLEALEDKLREAIDGLRQAESAAEASPSAARPRRGRSTARRRVVGRNSPIDALYDFQSAVWGLRRGLEQVTNLLNSVDASCATRGALIIDGTAGCGKSHVLADVASDRTTGGMPTILVLGQHLSAGSIWTQIMAEIGLDLTGQEFLDALEVAARVRGTGRALVAIDAINEGAGAQLWHDRLAGFLSDLTRHPWVAVALTIRDTYVESVVPHAVAADTSIRVTHPGLAGHEEEALHLYAVHYKLRLPDIPPLLPELTNPLFLRSLCRSVQQRGLTAIPREAMSLTWVFGGLLEAINGTLSRPERLDVDPADDLVGRAASAMAEAMVDTDDEALPVEAAKEICTSLHSEQKRSKSLFEALVTEGLLLRERVRAGGGDPGAFVDRVRFTYQRLADHLRAEAILARSPDNRDLAKAVRALVIDRSWSRAGLIEALALLVPERRDVELATLLRMGPRAGTTEEGEGQERSIAQRREDSLRGPLGRAFFAALPWRDPASITEKTRELTRRYLTAGTLRNEEWLRLLLTLACVPGHPFNACLVDRQLRLWALPVRDEYWSDSVLGVWTEDPNPVSRTIDFAWSGEHAVADDVAALAGTTLAWLLTSPNRRLRDTATKALLRLVEHRTSLLSDLVQSFADVDDPYIMERLLAVASGHAIRHRHVALDDESLDDLTALARTVFDIAFSGPIPDHLLIRAYARACVGSIVSTLEAYGRQLDRDAAATEPPYGSSWPLHAPSVRELARRYGGRSSSSITGATELGYDFVHYIIERGVAEDFVLPDQARRKARRSATQHRKMRALRDEIAASLPPSDRDGLVNMIDSLLRPHQRSFAAREAWRDAREAVPSVVADDVSALEQMAWSSSSDMDQPVRPDAALLARWIAQRVIELGWTKERFGKRDEGLARARAHRWTETERFGKKYTWIAFYELLGHLADHCMIQEQWHDAEPECYDTPWEVSHAADLDPTVVLRSDTPPDGTVAARLRKRRLEAEDVDRWWIAPHRHLIHSAGDDAQWLRDTKDVPEPESLLRLRDPEGREWLVLESHATWSLPFDEPRRSDAPRRQLWVRTQANLVHLEDDDRVARWASTKNWMGLWMPTPPDYYEGCLLSYPDLRPWPRILERDERERRGDDSTIPSWWETVRHDDGQRLRGPKMSVSLATSGYHSELDRDESSADQPRAILPSPNLVELLGAHWAGADTVSARELGLGAVEREFSWLASDEVVAFATARRTYGATMLFCVRAEPLRTALSSAGFGMWSWILGEKIYWTGSVPSHDRTEIYGAVGMTEQLTVWGFTIEHCKWNGNERTRTTLSAD